MVTMTYMASERAFPGYNIMATAKAALECSVRYLAYELGPRGDPGERDLGRAGADAGVGRHRRASRTWSRSSRSARRCGQNIEAADVGQAALYLCSPMSRMVTGTTVYVDSGYHAMGI